MRILVPVVTIQRKKQLLSSLAARAVHRRQPKERIQGYDVSKVETWSYNNPFGKEDSMPDDPKTVHDDNVDDSDDDRGSNDEERIGQIVGRILAQRDKATTSSRSSSSLDLDSAINAALDRRSQAQSNDEWRNGVDSSLKDLKEQVAKSMKKPRAWFSPLFE
jgi:hypothetical protein